MLDIERGDVANVSTISLGSHTGRHMDAPIHFVHGGEGTDRMPLDATMGLARVIEIQDPTSIKPDELDPHGIGRGERVLFKTRNSSLAWCRSPWRMRSHRAGDLKGLPTEEKALALRSGLGSQDAGR